MQQEDLYPLLNRSGTRDTQQTTPRASAVDVPTKPRKRSWWADAGWRFSLTTSAITAFVVLLINLSVTIWSTTKEKWDLDDDQSGLRILQHGSCDDIRVTNTAVHLAINILSTFLLGASNYCMQCLSAPTRDDVQKAHAKSKWLDIGVPSVHNLSSIPWLRVCLWILLILSSVPLHLLYNSVVFSSLVTVEYEIYTIQDNSTNDKSIFDISFAQANASMYKYNGDVSPYNYYYGGEGVIQNAWEGIKNGTLKNLTALECIEAYDTAFQTTHTTLVMVTDKGSNSSLYGVPIYWDSWYFSSGWGQGCPPDVYEWICPDSSCEKPCRTQIANVKENADNWKPYGGQRVKYCLSQPVTQYCRLYFSTTIISYIIVANAVKVAIILYTVLRPPRGLLLVIGDAIESFLTSPDAHSMESCLVSKRDIKGAKKKKQPTTNKWSPLQWPWMAAVVPRRWSRHYSPPTRDANQLSMSWNGPRIWNPVRRRWGAAVSPRRWITSLSIYLIAFGTTLGLMLWGISAISGPHDMASLWALGVGKTTEVALISGFPDKINQSRYRITWIIVMANFPQFCFSFLYFQYNGLFTGMLAAKEWSDFGLKRRSIRVSADPRGQQRSRYFLQLPYRWGGPLMVVSILIHWMISQSLFVVAIESPTEALWATGGYSPAAIMLVLLISFAMVLAVTGTGMLRLPSSIPLVGSYSLAIAAACHHPDGIPQPEAPLVPLKWGVMRKPGGWPEGNSPGHCGFSSEHVDEPEPGVEYA